MNGLLKLLVIEDRTNLAVAIACPEWRHYFHLGLTNILFATLLVARWNTRKVRLSFNSFRVCRIACLSSQFVIALNHLFQCSFKYISPESDDLVDEESLKVLTTRMVVTVLGS